MRPNEPPLALCGPSGTLVADGVRTHYSSVPAAHAALRSDTAPILLGALPFDVNGPAALLVPGEVLRSDAMPDWPTGPLPAESISAAIPTPADYRARICRARDQLAAPGNSLHKVVLARALQLAADAPLDAHVILRRLVAADPAAYGYIVDLTSAGDGYAGAALVGASPELLVARSGDRVVCQPFAGSARRAADPELDAANGAALAASAKNRHEHELVIDTMRAALEPLCDDLTIASEPQLSRTAAVWHLCTPIAAGCATNQLPQLIWRWRCTLLQRSEECRRKPHPSSSPSWKVTAVSMLGPWAGATPAATAIGWWPSAVRSCRRTAAPHLKTSPILPT